MSSERLQRWLVRHAAREATRRRSVEDALLSNRFVPYASRRLVGFALTRLWATAAHLIELAFLLHLFRFRAQVASLALANVAFIVAAFWWGALEILRGRIRTETSTAKIQQETTRWLTRSAWLALAAVALPLLVSLWRARWAHESLSVLDAYAWVCGLRLGVDLVLRTLFSGVYAKRRVYRPLATLLLADPIGLLVVVALWPRFGAWTFPLGLAISVAVSRGVALFYTLEAYRLLRLPPPRLSLWPRAARRVVHGTRAPSQRGRVLLAGAASVSARLGPVLVLAVLMRSTINNEELGALAFTLHLAGPLLSGTASWSQVFYHDFKRLEDDVSTGLRRHLTRRLGWLALTVGAVLWLLTGIVAVAFFGGSVAPRDLLPLLPLYLALAYLGVLQLRDFAHGDFSRMLGAGLVVFTALTLLLLGRMSSLAFGLPVGAALASGIAVLAVLGARERTPPSGPLLPSLFAWLGRLHAVRSPVRIGWGRVAGGAARYGHQTAERIASLLDGRGAVTTLRAGRRVLWFEAAPATLRPETLIVAAAGTLAAVHVTAEAPDGAHALDRALFDGLLENGNGKNGHHASSPTVLEHRFFALFPDGLIVDVARPGDTLRALAPSIRTAIWRDALREAHSGRTSRQRSGFEVTSYRPGGEIQLLFVASRKQPLPVRLAWREALEAANWSAAIVRTEARERLTALG